MNRRKEFTKETQRQAIERAKVDGVPTCECHRVPQLVTFGVGCGVPLGPANTFFEHIIPCKFDGDSSLENCAALSRTCWKAKTATYDLPVIAKAKRVNDQHFGITDPHRQRLPGGKYDRLKKKVSGEIVAR